MKNLDVIKKFINGEVKGKTQNLKIEGDNLINYSTIIAKRGDKGIFKVNSTKYSVSTTTIQNALRRELEANCLQYVEIDGKELNA